LLEKYSINFNLNGKYFMMDFEKASRKAFKKVFPEAHLLGCYFHYIKALWNKEKKKV
jgi:transposase-like protein